MAVLISQNRRLLFILVKAQLYQPRQTAVFLYAARQGDETMFNSLPDVWRNVLKRNSFFERFTDI